MLSSNAGQRWLAVISAVVFAVVSARAQQTVLNMSHDLVRLGIATQNLTPDNPSLDARPLFQATLAWISNHPVQVLTLDKGNYYFLSDQNPPYIGLVIPALSNMTIDLAGSTLWYSDPQAQGLDVNYCKNLVLTNFNTDFLTLPYAHVTLTSVDAANRVLHYTPISGFPDPAGFSPYATADESSTVVALAFRNGEVVPGTARMPVQGPIANGALPLLQSSTAPWMQSSALSSLLQIGDTIVVTWRGGQPRVVIWHGDGVTLSNVNVYGSSGWAVQVDESQNTTLDHVDILPRPNFGLVGSNADGIHINNTGPNNHVRNSYITRTVDDAIAIDALQIAAVVSQPSTRELVVERSGYLRFPNGTMVNFVDPASAMEISGGVIVSQSPDDSQNPTGWDTVTLTFDRDLPALAAKSEMVMGTAPGRGNGSTIEDNLVEDIPFGRATWVSGVEGVTLQRNVFRRTADALAVQYETTVFPGPPAHDVTLQDNVFESLLGPMAQGEGSLEAMGSIVVSASGQDASGQPNFITPNSPNTGISILDNYVADSGRSGIWAANVNGGTIDGNLITGWYEHPELPSWGAPDSVTTDFSQPFVLHNTVSVTTGTNVISAASPAAAPVTFAPASANFSSAGGQGQFAVTTAIAGFGWNAIASGAWITIRTTVPALGSATLNYSVAPNFTSAVRTGTITIAGEVFAITQAAGPETVVPQSGWWWDPNLNGMGLFIETGGSSGSGMFLGGFMCDASGNPTWYVRLAR